MSNLLPDGWSVDPFEKVINKLIDFRGKTPKKLGMDWGGGDIRALSANNVQMGKVNFNKECYLASNELYDKWMTKGHAEKNDVLLTMEAPLGNVALVPDSNKYILSQRVILLKVNLKKIYSLFLYQQLKSDFFQRLLQENATGTTALGIPQKKLVKLGIIVPPLAEQQKIAKILTSVDEVIEKTQAQIDKLKDLKTGMMQELLTNGIGHTEFKDSPVGRIPAEWEVKPLSALIDVMESGWSPQCESYPAVAGEWGVLKTTSVKWEGFNFKENKKLPEFLEPRLTAQVEHKDILITRAGPAERVGVVAYVDKVPKKIMLSDKIIRLKTKDSCNTKFLSLWLSCDTTKHYVASRISGLAQSQTNISQDILKRCPCVVPPLYEQEVIALTLSSIEKRHNELTLKLAQSKSAKKALMQDLLTGKVRVKIDSE
ncbi:MULTISPECIES: restriction endonuclease subunit S [Pseudoalteromonas]|uniref:restriction endonuclease subunit S n=1 Tax=Pseudoalteromonas TaxID=53246 RepID=UPI00300271CE